MNSKADERTGLVQPKRTRTWQSMTTGDLEKSEYDGDREFEPWEKEVQRGFIVKVYSILLTQIVITVGLSAACCMVPALREKCLAIVSTRAGINAVMYGGLGGSIVALLMLACCFRDSYPMNFILLGIFTLCEAATLAILSLLFVMAGKQTALLAAAGTTAFIFLSLTLYVKFSKTDFSFLGPFLFVMLLSSILLGLIAFIFKLGALTFGLHVLGVVMWTGFIIYDTDQILKRTSVDEMSETGAAIMGAVDLYLDIINLFLDLLYLFDRFT